jgi:hypothetical protein
MLCDAIEMSMLCASFKVLCDAVRGTVRDDAEEVRVSEELDVGHEIGGYILDLDIRVIRVIKVAVRP